MGNVSRGAIVADEEDVGLAQVNRLEEAGQLHVHGLKRSKVACGVGVSIGGGEVGGRIVERSMWGIEGEPAEPRVISLSVDEGDRIIDLIRGCVGVGDRIGGSIDGLVPVEIVGHS